MFPTINNVFQPHLFTQDSIMSLDMSLSRVSRCLANSSSGQCRSLMNVCSASSFQNKSSEVPEPLLPTPGHVQKTQSVRDTVSYFNQSSMSGRKRSGKGQEVGRSEGKGLLKKTKPVSSPHAMVAHLVYLFFTTSRSLTIVPWKK